MTLMYIPDIEEAVLTSCKDLIEQYEFSVYKKMKNEVYLLSQNCGIRIIAGVSPIGERQIDLDFFNPNLAEAEREYYSHTFLLYIGSRMEPRDILRSCSKESDNFDEILKISFHCFTAHTLKYREDILKGDFITWRP